jgi:hypothetical protein
MQEVVHVPLHAFLGIEKRLRKMSKKYIYKIESKMLDKTNNCIS